MKFQLRYLPEWDAYQLDFMSPMSVMPLASIWLEAMELKELAEFLPNACAREEHA